jgi:hypothetical protein
METNEATRETFKTHALNGELPTYAVGQVLAFPRIGRAYVYAILPAGTIDVEAADGRCYRITGLLGANWAQGGAS